MLNENLQAGRSGTNELVNLVTLHVCPECQHTADIPEAVIESVDVDLVEITRSIVIRIPDQDRQYSNPYSSAYVRE